MRTIAEIESDMGEKNFKRQMEETPLSTRLNEFVSATKQLFCAKEKLETAQSNVDYWESKLEKAFEMYLAKKLHMYMAKKEQP